MQKKATQKSKLKLLIAIGMSFVVSLGCLSTEGIKTELSGVRNDLGELEQLVSHKADNSVVAEQIDTINSRVDQTTQIADEFMAWRKSIEAETITYSGAGWVVVGSSIMAIIFLGAGLLLIKAFMKRGQLLTLLTGAVKNAGNKSPEIAESIKKQLKLEVSEGRFREQDRKNLGNFAIKVGTFSKRLGS